MSDGSTPTGVPPTGWWGLLYFAVITGITLFAEYLRRIMPPPRRRHRDHDPDDLEEENE